jgi:hypothetical protein
MLHILSFDPSRLRGHPSAGRKQMLDQELRQPRLIAFGLPTLFHNQGVLASDRGVFPRWVEMHVP